MLCSLNQFRRFSRFAVFFVGSIISFTATGQIERSTAEALLQQSGNLAQIDGLPAQFRANFEQALREQRDLPITSEEVRKFAAMGDTAFESSKLRASIIDAVSKRISSADATALRGWYNSAAGLKMLALEAAATSADHAAAVRRGTALLERMPKEQAAQLRTLMEASRAPEFVANLSINLAVAAAHAAASATSPRDVPAFASLREGAAREREKLVQSIGDVMIAVYANTYDRASEAEIAQYLALLQSTPGRAFSDALIVAFDRTIATSLNELSAALVELKRPPPRRR
ncbi:MAG: hypothetical protein EAZ24_04685 [Burkholderiales bacterium]|nr:MAG: hypothetical protein EAZ24_04685 [Burkholderiales bacterium]